MSDEYDNVTLPSPIHKMTVETVNCGSYLCYVSDMIKGRMRRYRDCASKSQIIIILTMIPYNQSTCV